MLLDDGREVRLKGIQAPKLPLGRAGFKPWPLSEEAKERLEQLAGSGSAILRYGGARGDRHGRVLAHVFVLSPGGEEIWLQQAMLREGLARVYTFPDNRACAELLLATEGEARNAARGIWAHSFYAIRDASDLPGLNRLAGRFELVEGSIRTAALVRGRLYLNFDEDYRKDFTVTVQERDVRIFRRDETWAAFFQSENGAAPGLDRLAGRTVRVRGWLGRNNGPEIVVTHPEQIEFTDKQD